MVSLIIFYVSLTESYRCADSPFALFGEYKSDVKMGAHPCPTVEENAGACRQMAL
jgi:hypothetical protein